MWGGCLKGWAQAACPLAPCPLPLQFPASLGPAHAPAIPHGWLAPLRVVQHLAFICAAPWPWSGRRDPVASGLAPFPSLCTTQSSTPQPLLHEQGPEGTSSWLGPRECRREGGWPEHGSLPATEPPLTSPFPLMWPSAGLTLLRSR